MGDLEHIYQEIVSFSNNLENNNLIDMDNFPFVYSTFELGLSYQLLSWLSRRLDLSLKSDQIKEIFRDQVDLQQYALQVIEMFDQYSYKFNHQLDDLHLQNPILSTWLQDSLPKSDRKSLASNYTEESQQLLALLPTYHELVDTSFDSEKNNRICDQFCGSGNLILAYLQLIESLNLSMPSLIRINDIMPTAVLLSYCRIISFNPEIEIKSSIMDGFLVKGEYDLVLINPPYTRSHRISSSTKTHLTSLEPIIRDLETNFPDQYFSTGHTGLHFWAILQVSKLLSTEGTGLFVLPRAIINAVYSQIIKFHLMEEYSSIVISQYSGKKAFSEGSALRELIVFVTKDGNSFLESNRNVIFTNIDSSSFDQHVLSSVSSKQLMKRWNWGSFFVGKELLSLESKLQEKISFYPLSELNLEIKRGIELYGANEFFYPNSDFNLEFVGNSIILKNGNDNIEFKLSNTRFTKVMRQPKLYTDSVSPRINHYALCLDETLNQEEKKLVDYVKPRAGAARRKFKDMWYQHPRVQLFQKEPIGHIFIIDKLDLTATPTLAYYKSTQTACTKNFYVLKSESMNFLEIKFLAAWLNSTFYFALYLLNRREIGGTYGRMQIIDYDYHSLVPKIPKISRVSENSLNHQKIHQILNYFDEFRHLELPSIVDQLLSEDRLKLDRLIGEYFGFDIDPSKLHKLLYEQIKSSML